MRVPGRLPLYQVWFDIQPETFEGDFKLEGADIKGAPKVCTASAGCADLLSLHLLQVVHDLQPWRQAEDGQAHAKMDLSLWMQEDGVGMHGHLMSASDIFDVETTRSMAKRFLVRPSAQRKQHADFSAPLCVGVKSDLPTSLCSHGMSTCTGPAGQHCGQPRHAHRAAEPAAASGGEHAAQQVQHGRGAAV